MIKLSNKRSLSVIAFCAVFFFSCAPNQKEHVGDQNIKTLVLENDTLKVSVDAGSGCFSVVEKISGQEWTPDPWEHAAGLLTLIDANGKEQTVNLSKCSKINVSQKKDGVISLQFADPVFKDGAIAKGIVIDCTIGLDQNSAKLDVQVVNYKAGDYRSLNLRYPAREFSLKTDVDKGAAVIPQKQGVICPSYIFPMNGGSFCQWDDATYDRRSIGTLQIYGNGTGLSMPWWGTYNEKSAVVGILDVASTNAKMEFNINNNGQYLFNAEGKFSSYDRIVFLDPVWPLDKPGDTRKITYHFIPGGNYVDMAKIYRKEAIARGYFKSLKEKAETKPDIKKLAGAVYLGIYGGYPHYVNMPGMAFTFDQLKEMIRVSHDDLKVKNAMVHAWGTFSNFPPECWPISKELGGTEKLKEVVDLAKKNGYLYSSYHAFTPLLENDPNLAKDMHLMGVDKDGKLKNVGGRWVRVDSKYFKSLAQESLDKENAAIHPNANITDIAFVDLPDSGRIELAKYLKSMNLVNGTEHGQEQWIPYFDMFEGMTYFEGTVFGIPLSSVSIKAPLFNLVYHDAVANFGKIQDPDNETSLNGDFRTKSLQNMLFGEGSLIFFAPYEFDGMKDMIKMANQSVSPVHRETFFLELVSHEYLSADFKVQRTRFSNGTEVIANLGAVAQKITGGVTIPGYGFQVTYPNGKVSKGQFTLNLTIN